MNSIEGRCLDALRKAWRRGVKSPRSPHKLDVLHGWIRRELLVGLPDYQVYGRTTEDGSKSQEHTVYGKYYQKKVDIVIARGERELGAVSVKLIQSSYKKNSVNYFEQQLGETANLRGQRLVYGNLIFMPHPIPIKVGDEWRTEYLTDGSLDRYRKLVADHDNIVVPDMQAIVIATLDQQHNQLIRLATRQDLDHLSEESVGFLFEQVSIAKFFRDYTVHVQLAYQRLVR